MNQSLSFTSQFLQMYNHTTWSIWEWSCLTQFSQLRQQKGFRKAQQSWLTHPQLLNYHIYNRETWCRVWFLGMIQAWHTEMAVEVGKQVLLWQLIRSCDHCKNLRSGTYPSYHMTIVLRGTRMETNSCRLVNNSVIVTVLSPIIKIIKYNPIWWLIQEADTPRWLVNNQSYHQRLSVEFPLLATCRALSSMFRVTAHHRAGSAVSEPLSIGVKWGVIYHGMRSASKVSWWALYKALRPCPPLLDGVDHPKYQAPLFPSQSSAFHAEARTRCSMPRRSMAAKSEAKRARELRVGNESPQMLGISPWVVNRSRFYVDGMPMIRWFCSAAKRFTCKKWLIFGVPSGKHTKSYWKWPFIVDLPIKNCDFP